MKKDRLVLARAEVLTYWRKNLKKGDNGLIFKKEAICRGKIRKGRCTKNMVCNLRPGEIALIDHRDLDDVAVEALLRARVKAILNVNLFVSGLFRNHAPFRLLKEGIFLLEGLNDNLFSIISEGDEIQVRGDAVWHGEKVVAKGSIFSPEVYEKRLMDANEQASMVAESFLDNTLSYAQREKDLLLGNLELPSLKTPIKGRDVVVVVRGKNYREDLQILRQYLKEAKPVLIGVDGGGDALWKAGFRPHIIIGDMDSASDEVLRSAREVIVHAYPDQRGAPGLERVLALGLDYSVLTAPGTSEDIAFLLAYEKGAELILALGAHFGVTEFLEKGRKGMASTFLVRLKVADKLIDAKGVSRLYRRRKPYALMPLIFLAGLLPVGVLLFLSPLVQQLFRIVFLRLRLGL